MTPGLKAARSRIRLSHGTSEPVVSMLRERLKRRPRKAKSTKGGEASRARHRDGTTRSSVERPVMRLGAKGSCHLVLGNEVNSDESGEELMTEDKPFCISKWAVFSRRGRKSAPTRGPPASMTCRSRTFEKKLKNNLYRDLESHVVGVVHAAAGAKGDDPQGRRQERPLGIPTVGDRVAQMVVKMDLEPKVEPCSIPTATGTGRRSRRWTRSASAGALLAL
jgi:RNA-directed DNA polymerase